MFSPDPTVNPAGSPEVVTTSDIVVTAREALATGVVGLTLAHPDGGPLPEWEPGAHIDLVLPNGATRQYSLCGVPSARTSYRIAVLRELDGRGGSACVHDEVEVRSTLGLGGPRNNFPLLPFEEYAFVAGGIGITPLLPMIGQAEAQGVAWTLLYGGRTRSSMAFVDELSVYGARVEVVPEDERGRLDLGALMTNLGPGAAIYCCGPGPLLDAVTDEHARHPSVGPLHVERFKPREDARRSDDLPFEVVLERSGVTIDVQPDQSILAAAELAGVPVLSSCQEGTCGTCETVVIEGVPDHRDSLLTDDERAANELMMICVSRSCTPRLVLDL